MASSALTAALAAQYVSLDRIWQPGYKICPSKQWTSYCPLGGYAFLNELVRCARCLLGSCSASWHGEQWTSFCAHRHGLPA